MKFLESFSKTSCDFFETGCYDSGKSKADSADVLKVYFDQLDLCHPHERLVIG